MGLESGFAPLCPPIHGMFLVCTGKICKKPIVGEGDKIEVAYMMNTVWTIDHRYGDAAIGLNFIRIVKDFVEDPENFNIEKYPNLENYVRPNDETKKIQWNNLFTLLLILTKT